MKLKFTKMHGLGNDYIYIMEDVRNPSDLSKILSNRHFGVGGDGLILVLPSEIADAKMRIFNADGSEAKMCGNGIRCVGRLVYENMKRSRNLRIETLSGVKDLEILALDRVKVNMGKPSFKSADIPVNIDKNKVTNEKIFVEDRDFFINCVSMGNPHCVVFLNESENLGNFDLERYGPKFEKNRIFPDGVNTEFVKILDKNTLEMRVWERGSAETLACGTGSCAAVASAILNGYCERNTDVTVRLRGGNLIVNSFDDVIYMTGEAVKIFDGEVEI